MAGLHQLLFVTCVLFSVATLTTAVPFDRQQGLSSNLYTKNISSDSENVCMIDDVLYQVGDPIPTASPCEKCVCRPPGFACSIITCEKRPNCRALQRSNQCCPEYKCDCEIDGKVYHNGEKLDNTQNPCKVCYCQGGEIACTVIECYKRDDCVPKLVPGMCCPKYDNCPPRDPARSASSSFGPPVETTNATTAREVPQLREVADDRLNLLGEPEPTNQQLPAKSISNNVYDVPQGDDPQAYEVYDDSSTGSTSTTGFFAYEYGLTSTSTPNYDSYDESSSTTTLSSTSSTASTSTSDGSSTSETTPWTNIPTFPIEHLTLEPDWTPTSDEHIQTWPVNYTELTTTEEILPWTWNPDNFTFPEYIDSSTVNTPKPDNASTDNVTAIPSLTSNTTDYYVMETTTSTDVTPLDEPSYTTLDTGSGDDEIFARISNCTDDILDCGQFVRVDYTKFNQKFHTSMFNPTTEFVTDRPSNSSILINEGLTSTASTSETEANTEDVTDQEASNESSELSTSETTPEVDSTGVMADMPGKDHEEASTTTDTWADSDQSTSQSDKKILHDVLELKDNRTLASLRAGEGDFNESTEESSTTEDESGYTATTESSTAPSLSEGDGDETSAPSTDDSGHTATETAADSTTTSPVTEIVAFESSTLETLSTTQTSETSGSQSTETGEDATTTENSS